MCYKNGVCVRQQTLDVKTIMVPQELPQKCPQDKDSKKITEISGVDISSVKGKEITVTCCTEKKKKSLRVGVIC